MEPQKFYITGSQGMLGTDLVRSFGKAFGEENTIGLPRQFLDITNQKNVFVFLAKARGSVLINAAAYTNVDGAESDRAAAFAANAQGPTYLAQACKEYGVRLVHFSTDQVFDGSGTEPKTEEDTPHPLNYYAETKLLGEKAVLNDAHGLVLRVQWLYGDQKDRFTILKDLKEFLPFSDQIGCPTWTKHVAELAVELVLRRSTGLLHLAYDDHASWLDVFRFVKEKMNYSVELFPRLTADAKLPAGRPLHSVLSNRKLLSTLQRFSLGSWKTALTEFLHSRV